MQKMDALMKEIETARKALEDIIESDNKELIYQRSIFLDKLIEDYLDLKESSTSLH